MPRAPRVPAAVGVDGEEQVRALGVGDRGALLERDEDVGGARHHDLGAQLVAHEPLAAAARRRARGPSPAGRRGRCVPGSWPPWPASITILRAPQAELAGQAVGARRGWPAEAPVRDGGGGRAGACDAAVRRAAVAPAAAGGRRRRRARGGGPLARAGSRRTTPSSAGTASCWTASAPEWRRRRAGGGEGRASATTAAGALRGSSSGGAERRRGRGSGPRRRCGDPPRAGPGVRDGERIRATALGRGSALARRRRQVGRGGVAARSLAARRRGIGRARRARRSPAASGSAR